MGNSIFEKYPIKFSITDAGCELLKSKYKDLTITDKQTYQAAIEGIREVRTLRISVEKKRKELKRDALDYGHLVDETARSITEKLIPVESHLKDLKKAEDDRRLQIKLEKERKEKERVDKIKIKLQDLSLPDPLSEDGQSFYLESSSQLRSRIVKLELYEILPDDFEEYTEKAKALKENTLTKIKTLERLKATQEIQARQAEEKRLEQEKALEKRRKAQEEEERLLEIEREKQEIILQNLRAEQEAKARLAEEKRLEQERILEEQAKALEAERQKQEAKARALEKKEKAIAQAEKESHAPQEIITESEKAKEPVPEVTEDQSKIKGISLTQDEREDLGSLYIFLTNLENLTLGMQQSLKSQGLQGVFSQFIEKSSDALNFLNFELNQWQKMKGE